VVWDNTDLVVIDEASMVTLEMLTGILLQVKSSCRVVLLGDPNQLLSVGSGNVIPDLLTLGVPHMHLETNHRQDAGAQGLLHNVVEFPQLQCGKDLILDNSFSLREIEEPAIQKAVVDEAVCRYLAGESVQVLSPYNRGSALSVRTLNAAIQKRVNPASADKAEISYKGHIYREGDRVMILQNDRERNCSNGDIGTLHIQDSDERNTAFCVEMSDGRRPMWHGSYNLELLSLAYALTIHKSQGSEYDTVLLPISMGMYRMLSRNLFYTAISRARKQVVLYGAPQAVDVAMQKSLMPRKSMLVAKTRMRLENACA
jgi:exodeoxyribonuclease V alpha subunit